MVARFEPSERLREVDGGVCKSLNSSDSLCIAFVWAWGFLVGFGLNKGEGAEAGSAGRWWRVPTTMHANWICSYGDEEEDEEEQGGF